MHRDARLEPPGGQHQEARDEAEGEAVDEDRRVLRPVGQGEQQRRDHHRDESRGDQGADGLGEVAAERELLPRRLQRGEQHDDEQEVAHRPAPGVQLTGDLRTVALGRQHRRDQQRRDEGDQREAQAGREPPPPHPAYDGDGPAGVQAVHQPHGEHDGGDGRGPAEVDQGEERRRDLVGARESVQRDVGGQPAQDQPRGDHPGRHRLRDQEEHHDQGDAQQHPPARGSPGGEQAVVGQHVALLGQRAEARRASDRSRPSSSIDSNSGGLTRRPVIATRTGP
ncbi:hypothetical protein NOMA109596_10265 [Nocardioides marinus]